eukprot:TRINITY_DN26051_c0_g1_i1.p1 TRINITY_DN26051_c0_g1~~TRINITY_DN26051_c0_g1_i1.p1  ORF type:complete len:143 (+),score=31.89 TRINITY_DN26051_c0_g1_i1:318-746(+)
MVGRKKSEMGRKYKGISKLTSKNTFNMHKLLNKSPFLPNSNAKHNIEEPKANKQLNLITNKVHKKTLRYANQHLKDLLSRNKNYISTIDLQDRLPAIDGKERTKLPSKTKRNSSFIGQAIPMYSALIPVSYTHLTLPTICSV